MAYRDDLEAAVRRADDVERELESVRSKNTDDSHRIAQLQRELYDAQRHLHYLGGGQNEYHSLPESNATTLIAVIPTNSSRATIRSSGRVPVACDAPWSVLISDSPFRAAQGGEPGAREPPRRAEAHAVCLRR